MRKPDDSGYQAGIYFRYCPARRYDPVGAVGGFFDLTFLMGQRGRRVRAALENY
ncbi:MAG: hypothetical protein LBD86_04840 [Spirochaetaceae bacterium]|nr:hypothetical protein [Spirochaetaceae bacterium]